MQSINRTFRMLAICLVAITCLSISSRTAQAIGDGSDFTISPFEGDEGTIALGLLLFVPTNLGFTIYDAAHWGDQERSQGIAIFETVAMTLELGYWGSALISGFDDGNDGDNQKFTALSIGFTAWSGLLFADAIWALADPSARSSTPASEDNPLTLFTPTVLETQQGRTLGLVFAGRF